MPLDDAGFRIDPAAYVFEATPAYNDRWSVIPGRTLRPRQGFTPRSDAEALLLIWQSLETKWARKLNDGDRHCITGWVTHTCEPMTVINYDTPQVMRLLQRLHDALPKSAQRKNVPPQFVLAKYNDTHSLPTVRAWVLRAYLAEVNARIDTLNNPTNA